MFSPRLLDHFSSPRHAGPLAPPAICVEAVNPACGDILKLCVKVENGVVTQAGFQARGCTASIAAGSALCEWLIDQPAAAIRDVSQSDLREAIEGQIDPLPPESQHVIALCFDACRILWKKLL